MYYGYNPEGMNANTFISGGNHKRIDYLDTAKGILILLVVLGHSILASGAASVKPYSVLMKFIYSFHMTAFLILSGLVFNTDKWRKKGFFSYAFHRARQLLLPYIGFETIGFLVHSFFSWGKPDSIPTGIRNLFLIRTYIGADWYLPTLFISELLFYCCVIYLGRTINCLVLISTFIFILFCGDYEESGALCLIFRLVICMCILLVGHYTKSLFLSKTNSLFLFLALIIVIISSQINQLVFLHIPRVNNIFLFSLCGLTGAYLCINLARVLNGPFFRILGCYSLIIMGTHQNIEYLIVYFFGTNVSWKYIISIFLAMILFEVIIIEIVLEFKKRVLHTIIR